MKGLFKLLNIIKMNGMGRSNQQLLYIYSSVEIYRKTASMLQGKISFFLNHLRVSAQPEGPITSNILTFSINQDIFKYKIKAKKYFLIYYYI